MTRTAGDGFIRCSDGHVRWGLHGAAGVLFVTVNGNGVKVMLQRRSAFAHEGGTWSVAGGALDLGEEPIDGAMREASEEIGELPAWKVVGEYRFEPATDWTYTTVVALVDEEFGYSANFETDDVGWFPPDEVEGLALHAGFAAAWPHLRAIVDDMLTDP